MNLNWGEGRGNICRNGRGMGRGMASMVEGEWGGRGEWRIRVGERVEGGPTPIRRVALLAPGSRRRRR